MVLIHFSDLTVVLHQNLMTSPMIEDKILVKLEYSMMGHVEINQD